MTPIRAILSFDPSRRSKIWETLNRVMKFLFLMFSSSIVLDFQCLIRIFKLIQTVGLQSLYVKFLNLKFEIETDAQIEAENHKSL